MNINVPPNLIDHFWDEPLPNCQEFWAFRWKPPCKVGDELNFKIEKKLVAKATCARIEPPGKSACDTTGKFKNLWKVFWDQDTFIATKL